MKKSIKIVSLVIVLLVILFSLAGCSNKEPITTEDFKTKMEAKDFSVQDVKSSQFSAYDYIEEAYVAIDSMGKYQIEFYVLTDESQATAFFNTNQELFENYKGNSSIESNVSIMNSSKYALTSSGKYMVVSKIANTAIYISESDTYKSDIEVILKELGY